MGASVARDGVTLRVWAPAAARVELELDGCLVSMRRETDDGVWAATTHDASAGTRYRFRIDGEGPFPDPYSRSQPEGPHGPSEVVDPDLFEWHDQDWHGARIEGLSIYQLHVGTFTPEGTFAAAIEQLPRLKALGVTAIEPLPIAEFPGTRNWGYDGVDLFAPSHVYGGPEGFRRLVDAAHQHGLAVLVDVVYNHLGPDGNYLRAFSPYYFTDRYQTPWGEAINYDGPHSARVRQLVIDNALAWLREYHVDGLRLDATHAIFDRSDKHILAELSETVRRQVERDVVLIAETHENDMRYMEPVDQGGFGLDAVWADDFHHTLRRYLAGDREGYYQHFQGTIEEMARAINNGWLRGKSANQQPPWQFVYVIQNHDQVGNRPFGDRLHHGTDKDLYRMASMLLLYLPMTPMLFMGQEFGASSPFQYFTDHHEELGRLVTEGRRREFKAFSAFSHAETREKIPDPQALHTFLRSKLPLQEAGNDLESLYQRLLHMRRDDAVLAHQAPCHVEARAVGEHVLEVRRWRDTDERVLVANFGASPFGVEPGWQLLISTGTTGSAMVAPRTAAIFRRGPA